uniref:Uncharacterized protein LOC111100799 n=1 Tax=Crassostrea virginica TaxID=6565 RepID=A0A8B8AAW9_CRAVI|nr:uncharacterized protein LOC111100799 [Crassostrea virginica]
MQGSDYINFKMIDSNNKLVPSRCTSLYDKPGSASRQSTSLDSWVLVYFPAEDAVCHPLLLQDVETLMGETGVQAGLREGDICLAPFFVGDGLHTALILRCSGCKTEILLEYDRVLEIRKSCKGNFVLELWKDAEEDSIEEDTKSSQQATIWQYAKYIGSGAAIGGLTAVAAPVVLSAGGAAVVVAIATKAVPVLALAGVGGVAVGDIIAKESQSGENTAQDPEMIANNSKRSTKNNQHSVNAKDQKGSTTNNHHSVFSSAGLSSAFHGMFNWFSGAPVTCNSDIEKKEQEQDDAMLICVEDDKKESENLIDIGEEPFTSPSVHHTGTGKTSKSLNHMEDPDDTVQDWLTLENRRLWEERLCKICADGETAVLFDPCGHMCACQFCSAVQRHCPMCGQFVQNHHRVFRS